MDSISGTIESGEGEVCKDSGKERAHDAIEVSSVSGMNEVVRSKECKFSSLVLILKSTVLATEALSSDSLSVFCTAEMSSAALREGVGAGRVLKS